jgi:hypothetical protein
MPKSKHRLSRAQQGYLFGVLGGPKWAHDRYRGVKSKNLPYHVRPKKRKKKR